MLLSMQAVTEVARLGSFSAAAKVLNLSPPSVSRIVGELEEELGIRLFNRTTRRVALTPEGREFAQRSETILEEIESLRDTAQERSKGTSGRLVVSSSVAFGNEMLAPAIPAFLSQYPEIEFDLRIGNRPVDLIEEHVDVALRVGVGGLPDSSLVAAKVIEYRLIFVAAPSYLEKGGEPKTLEQLEDHQMVKIATGSWGHVQRLETPQGVIDYHVPDRFTVDAYRAQLNIVLGGYGCALLHEIAARREIEAGRLVRILPDHQTTAQSIYAVYAHRTFLASRIRVFLNFLKEHFA